MANSNSSSCLACLFSTLQPTCCNLNTSSWPPMHFAGLPSRSILAIAFLLYLAVLQLLRHRRQNNMTTFITSNQPLQPGPAQDVVRKLATLEFPLVHKLAIQFALFRTYGIPSISGLLQQTSLFSAPATAARRYADTSVLIAEFMARTYGSRDWVKPIARTNAIHGAYRDKGRIAEADMLYTLLLFARQPWKWIDAFEWRSLTEAELDALGTFWRAVGEAMEIDYTGLGVPGWREEEKTEQEGGKTPMTANGRGRGEWRTGADWLRAVDVWAEMYERKHMVTAESNAVVAEQTIILLLDSVPKFLHPLGRQAVSSLMDKRLRRAMSIPDPPIAVHCTIHSILALRKLAIRYLLPPRPDFLQVKYINELYDKTADGRNHILIYDNMPYYVKPTFMNRWGLGAWIRWMAGKPLPGDSGMESEGYLSHRVGPPAGKAEKERTKRENMVEEVLAGRGCPMAFR